MKFLLSLVSIDNLFSSLYGKSVYTLIKVLIKSSLAFPINNKILA